MLICKDCHTPFDESESATHIEKHGLDTPPFERWDACPICGSINLTEAATCKVCQKVVDPENCDIFTTNENGVRECYCSTACWMEEEENKRNEEA